MSQNFLDKTEWANCASRWPRVSARLRSIRHGQHVALTEKAAYSYARGRLRQVVFFEGER